LTNIQTRSRCGPLHTRAFAGLMALCAFLPGSWSGCTGPAQQVGLVLEHADGAGQPGWREAALPPDSLPWYEAAHQRLAFFSGFFAVMTTILVFGLVISLVVSTPFRWSWLAFTASATALVAVHSGLAHQYLWPSQDGLQVLLAPLLSNAAFYAGIVLLQQLYPTRRLFPALNRALRLLRYGLLIGMLLCLPLPWVEGPLRSAVAVVHELVFLYGAVLVPAAMLRLITRLRGWEPRVMLLALAPQSLGVGLHALQNLCLYRPYFDLSTLNWAGIINAILLLTLVLLRRIRMRMDQGFRFSGRAAQRRQQNTLALLEREAELRRGIGEELDGRLGPLMLNLQESLSKLQQPALLQQLDEARTELRAICDNRIPGNLTGSGLILAIEEILRPLQAAGARVRCTYPRPRRLERLDPLYQMAVFRIVQGLLNNVYRHAGATSVNLELDVERGGIRLVLQDDGVGFETGAALEGGGGRGLGIIRQRIENLGGHMELQSSPGRGSRFFMQIPLKF
jgi:two-component system NarL family sensor kinase